MRELTWVESQTVAGGYKSLQTVMNDHYQDLIDTWYVDFGGSVGYQWWPGMYEQFFAIADNYHGLNVSYQNGALAITSNSTTGSNYWYDVNGDSVMDVNFTQTSEGYVYGDYDGDGYFETWIGDQEWD